MPASDNRLFYHGSMAHLPVGHVLTARPWYRDDWGHTPFYQVLERYRPKGVLAHHQAVFFCASDEDVDLAGGGTEWLFTVTPQGPVTRHDMNWSSAISVAVDEGASEATLAELANAYWSGTAHPDESVWEYLAASALIVAVEPY